MIIIILNTAHKKTRNAYHETTPLVPKLSLNPPVLLLSTLLLGSDECEY